MLSIRVMAILILATIHSLQALPSIWMHNNLLERHFLGNPVRQNNNYVVKQHFQHHQSDHDENHKQYTEPSKPPALRDEPILRENAIEKADDSRSRPYRYPDPESHLPIEASDELSVEENFPYPENSEQTKDHDEHLSYEDEEFLLEMLAEGLELENKFKKLLKARANDPAGHHQHVEAHERF